MIYDTYYIIIYRMMCHLSNNPEYVIKLLCALYRLPKIQVFMVFNK